MSKMEELNRYKRNNLLKPLSRLSKEQGIQRKNNIQPIVHKNTKMIANDIKLTDIRLKNNELFEQQKIHDSTFKKMPGKSYNNNNNNNISNIQQRPSKQENVTDFQKNKLVSHAEEFQALGLYEIQSYQLIEVSKKETDAKAQFSKKNMDLCRKSAKQAAKFFHLAKVHKSKQISNPYMKFVDKVLKKPATRISTTISKSKLPALGNDELQNMLNFMGIEVATQTENFEKQTWFTTSFRNALIVLLVILLSSNILLLLALGLNINCKLEDPFPSLQFWQKLHGLFSKRA